MFEKISALAEQAATSASRRQFLGRLGRGAMAATAALAGLLAHPSEAQAARRVCWTSSQVIQCRGLPLGSPCTAGNGRPGRCVSDGNVQIAPGVYDCNVCKPKGGGRSGRR